jgi:hypothetical protein
MDEIDAMIRMVELERNKALDRRRAGYVPGERPRDNEGHSK